MLSKVANLTTPKSLTTANICLIIHNKQNNKHLTQAMGIEFVKVNCGKGYLHFHYPVTMEYHRSSLAGQ